jgi:hypothetical protein
VLDSTFLPTGFNAALLDIFPSSFDPFCHILRTRFVTSSFNQPFVDCCCNIVFLRFLYSNVHWLTVNGVSTRNKTNLCFASINTSLTALVKCDQHSSRMRYVTPFGCCCHIWGLQTRSIHSSILDSSTHACGWTEYDSPIGYPSLSNNPLSIQSSCLFK